MRRADYPAEPSLSFSRSSHATLLGMPAVIALIYLAREHSTHTLGLLPYLLLLLCPLLHLFGHRHGGHHHRATQRKDSDQTRS